jgi:hypothetical protein
MTTDATKSWGRRSVLNPANTWTLVLIVTLCCALAYSNSHLLFIDWSLPRGDDASNDILIMDAKRLALLHGNYSRVSFYHPGPFYLQWQALVEWLLFDSLRLFVSPRAAHYFAIALLHAAAFGLYFRLWLQWTGSLAVASAALIITAAVPTAVIGQNYIISLWPPHWYVASALMTVTGLIGIAALGMTWLPLFVFGLGQLVHGHASFLGLVPVMLVTAAAAALVAGRMPLQLWRIANATHFLGAHWRPLAISAAIAALFALPILIYTLLHWPGELAKYLYFSRGRSNPIREVVWYVISFMPLSGVWALAFMLPPRPSQARVEPTIYRYVGLLVLATGAAPALLYAWRGVDTLSERYLIYWMLPFVGAALACAIFYFASLLSAGVYRIAFVAIVAVGSLGSFRAIRPVEANVIATVLTSRALDLLARRVPPGEKIAIQIDHGAAGWPPAWSETASLIALMNRKQQNILCVERSSWHLVFHERYRCKPSDRIADMIFMQSKRTPRSDVMAELGEANVVPSRTPTVGVQIKMPNFDGISAMLLGDWSGPEPWGIWSDGNRASLLFDASALPERFTLSIQARLFPPAGLPAQSIRLTDGSGRELAVLDNTSGQSPLTVRIQAAKPPQGRIFALNFEIPRPVSPRELRHGNDNRRLGIGLERLAFDR